MVELRLFGQAIARNGLQLYLSASPPPHSGKFFYVGNTAMLRNMRRAVELSFGESNDFLESFKAYGWYLDDLVRTPVNKGLLKSERKAKCLDARKSLADRIAGV